MAKLLRENTIYRPTSILIWETGHTSAILKIVTKVLQDLKTWSTTKSFMKIFWRLIRARTVKWNLETNTI